MGAGAPVVSGKEAAARKVAVRSCARGDWTKQGRSRPNQDPARKAGDRMGDEGATCGLAISRKGSPPGRLRPLRNPGSVWRCWFDCVPGQEPIQWKTIP